MAAKTDRLERLVLSLLVAISLGLASGEHRAAAAQGGHVSAYGGNTTAALFRGVHGKWKRTSTAHVLDELRGVLTVRGGDAQHSAGSPLMQIRHVTWQNSHRIEMAPTVSVKMHQRRRKGGPATFVATVRLPILLPLLYSQVVFLVSRGEQHTRVTTVLRVEARLGSSSGVPTLTVPQAFTFCSKRPRWRGLPYGVNLTGYAVTESTSGGAGPVSGVILDRPRNVTWDSLGRPRVPRGHSIYVSGLPVSNRWTTLMGALGCGDGAPDGYAIGGI